MFSAKKWVIVNLVGCCKPTIPDRSAVEVQYILHIHFSDSAVYTTGTLQLEGSISAV